MVKLSIIIPAYNAEPYIYELLDVLKPQITKEVEVFVIDDGSRNPLDINEPWIKFMSNDRNRGISYTRNRGLELAKGDCIHFLDADDLVPDNYVEYIINLIDTREFDYIDLSWKSLPGGGANYDIKLNSDNDYLTNPSASTRIFKRSFIGDTRFAEKKDAAEDEDFTRHLGIKHAKRICATEYMYFYRTYVPDSNSKRFIRGERRTHRVGYFYRNFTKAMKDEFEAIKRDDELHEVILLTYKNEVPEIEKYATVFCPPQHTRVMEAKGEPSNMFTIIPTPIKADIVIWTKSIDMVGGIESFIYNFCACMREKYNIVVLYERINELQKAKITKYARCVQNEPNKVVVCDTLIVNRIGDNIAPNIKYEKIVQIAHCIRQQPTWHIPQRRDAIVCVSNASKQSFGDEGKKAKVINNLLYDEHTEKALLLVSATRVNASDKGGNDDRMRKLAKLMKDRGIKFVWLYWGNMALHNAPEGMIYMGVDMNIKPYIKMADYLVQLSDSEAFSYSLLESLCLGTALIVTPLSQNKDMKIKDGVNAHIVPFDFDESYDVEKFKDIPKFNYKYDNQKLIDKWVDVIENTVPAVYDLQKPVFVKVVVTYQDLQIGRILSEGEVIQMESERADELSRKGLVEIVR